MPTYHVTDSITGRKLKLTGESPPTSQELEQIFGGYRQDTVQEKPKTWSQKLGGVPLIGQTLQNITSIGTGLGSAISTPILEKQTGEAQREALKLARLAQTETDPIRKQDLLQRSRDLSQGAGEKATRYAETVRSGVGDFADRESPTNLGGSIRAYAPAGMRSGVEIGTFVAPAIKGAGLTGITKPIEALTGKALGRIVGSGITGATIGGTSGFWEGDEKSIIDRVESGLESGATGFAVGGVLQTGIEALGGIGNLVNKLSSKAKQKFKDVYASTLKNTIKSDKFVKQAGGMDKLVNDSIKYNIPATKDGVKRELEKFGPEHNKIMTRLSKEAESKGAKINIAELFEKAKKETANQLSYDKSLQKAGENWFKQNSHYSNQTSALPSSVNRLRIKLDQKVGSMITSDIGAGADKARKLFASELRNAFKGVVGPEGQMAIRRYHLLSGLSEAMQVEPKLGIVELTAAAASPGKGAMNILEVLGAKAIRSPGLKRVLSKLGITKVSPTKLNLEKLKSASPAVMKTITDLLNKESQ